MLQDDDQLRRVLQEAACIAVVGASDDEDKAAHDVPAYLQERGYRIIPVNPGNARILGEPAFDDLSEVDQNVDVVQVFRPAEEAPAIARKAVALGASVLWLQEGIVSEDAQRIAEDAGLDVVMDACMMQTHRRLVASDGPSS